MAFDKQCAEDMQLRTRVQLDNISLEEEEEEEEKEEEKTEREEDDQNFH
jgi:hypothetical protein